MLYIGLFNRNFKQRIIDPYLYLKEDVKCAIYVNKAIFWSPNEANIDRNIGELKAHNFDLTDEGEVDSFLGIIIDI